jgi:hypothetical protein
MGFLIYLVCWKKQLGKKLNHGSLGWKEDSNKYITFFFFETMV